MDIMIDLLESDAWKIELTIAINIISLKDVEEKRVMHSKSNNIKFRSYNYANQTVDDLFESLRSRYQGSLETSMEESEFVLDSAQLMHYQCRKVNFRRVG